MWNGVQVSQQEREGTSQLNLFFLDLSPICVLLIDLSTQGAWRSLEKVYPAYLMGENDRYIFAAKSFSTECVQMDGFVCDRYHEVPEILASLEIRKDDGNKTVRDVVIRLDFQ